MHLRSDLFNTVSVSLSELSSAEIIRKMGEVSVLQTKKFKMTHPRQKILEVNPHSNKPFLWGIHLLASDVGKTQNMWGTLYSVPHIVKGSVVIIIKHMGLQASKSYCFDRGW